MSKQSDVYDYKKALISHKNYRKTKLEHFTVDISGRCSQIHTVDNMRPWKGSEKVCF